MSVSDRTKRRGALSQLVRTFFQRYDDAESPDHIATLRSIPGGSLVTFLTEQVLQRTQRNFFGITLVEIKRVLEYAKQEAADLRASFAELHGQIDEVRSLIRKKS